MIPLKLQIKNFVSYGSTTQTIDFAPYSLICLSGRNGHGKSALLDALTWAIWGQARKIAGSAKADEGLLRLGQSQMMVTLDFICNNIFYRIRREFNANNQKHVCNLDFGIVDPTTNLYRPLTDKTIKTTQEKIETMLGLTYESFVNSAFLRQGQSNEFSKKTPKDRKDILGSIIGLDQFERIRKRAHDRAKEKINEKDHILKNMELLQRDIAQKDDLMLRFNELQEQLQTLLNKETDYKIQAQQLKATCNQLQNIKRTVEKLEFQHEQTTIALDHVTNNVMQDIKTYRAINREKKNNSNFKAFEDERYQLQAELIHIHTAINEKIALKEQYIQLKEDYKTHLLSIENDYDKELELNKATIQQQEFQFLYLENQINSLTLTKNNGLTELTTIKNQIDKLDSFDNTKTSETLQKIEIDIERKRAFYHMFNSKKNILTIELTNLVQKQAITENTNDPKCPLCEQNLALEFKKGLMLRLDKQKSFNNHQINRLNLVLNNIHVALQNQIQNAQYLKLALENQKNIDVQVRELEKQYHKLNITLEHNELELKSLLANRDLMKSELEKNKQALVTLNGTILKSVKENTKLNAIQNQITDIENQLQKYNTDNNREQIIKNRLHELDQLLENHAQILKNYALQEQRKETIHKAFLQIKQLKHNKKTYEQEILLYQNELKEESLLISQEQELMHKIQLLLQEKERLIHQKGALEQMLQTLQEKERSYNNYKVTLQNLDETIDEYTAIASALSKDGVQALLIEDIIPEIEQEANALLSKLTDNQAQLSIESLRDLRSGKAKETLDIKISDPIGIRPYELFSGGEAFRIDFALRIAISKLLARRAGTSLQTLIIDEGFGSQDDEGLSNILDALLKIQEDFAKVIIVSHLNTLKEQMPVHFMVYKTAQGSMIKVIEQG